MSVLEKSPLYQQILEKGREVGREEGREEGREAGREEGREAGREEGREAGREEGREAGREEGREEGLEEGLERAILRILRRRFDAFEPDLPDRLAELPPAELEELLDEAITAVDYAAFTTFLTSVEERR